MEEDTVELIDYLRVIWKRKRLILVGTLACMVTAGVVSLLLPEVYKASVTFLLEESKISKERVVSQINPGIFETYGKTYIGIIKNKTAMNQAIKEFQLDKEPYEFTLEDFDELISVDAVEKSKLLNLVVELPDPQLARDIANFLAGKAVELNNTLSAIGSAENRDFIRGQMEVAKKAMDEAESELLRFKEKAQLAVLNKKLNILLSRKGEIEKALSHSEVAIAENAERLKRIEEEFKKTNSTIKLSRKLAENPLYQQSLAEHSGSDIKKMFNLNMEVEIANPTYQHLEKKLVDVIPTLSALYVKRDSLQAELKANTLELKTTQVELANKETELQRLKRTYDLAFGTYKMFVKKFEEVTIQVAMMSQDLKILDPAIIPEEPFKPKKKLNVLIAGVIGSMMFLVLAFFREYLERAKKKQEGAV